MVSLGVSDKNKPQSEDVIDNQRNRERGATRNQVIDLKDFVKQQEKPIVDAERQCANYRKFEELQEQFLQL